MTSRRGNLENIDQYNKNIRENEVSPGKENDDIGNQLPFTTDEHFVLNVNYDEVFEEPDELDLFTLLGEEGIDMAEKREGQENDCSNKDDYLDLSPLHELQIDPTLEIEELINYREEEDDDFNYSEFQKIYFLPPPPPLPKCGSVSPEPSLNLPCLFDTQMDCITDQELINGSNHITFNLEKIDLNFEVGKYPNYPYYQQQSATTNKKQGPFIFGDLDSPSMRSKRDEPISIEPEKRKKKMMMRDEDEDDCYKPSSKTRINFENDKTPKRKKRTTRSTPSSSNKNSNSNYKTKKSEALLKNIRKRRKSQADSGQVFCCVKGCENTVQNRLRFSLRCLSEEGSDFKPEFLKVSWDKVCHYHYFSDLYKFKKKQKMIKEEGLILKDKVIRRK